MWCGINMFSGRLLPCLVLLLCYVPGAQCSYKYNVAGLVASSVAGLFLLVLVVVMLVVIVMWRDWYERKQSLKGRPKRPRRYWGLFQGRKRGQASLISTPRSDRKLHSAGRNHVVYGSRNTTLTRADDWMNKVPHTSAEFSNQNSKYEEKVQTITLEPEEEAIIIADLLPEDDTRTRPTVLTNHDPAPTRKVDYDPGPDYRHDENTHYVAYSAPKSNYESRQQLKHTMPATYHVKLSHLDEPPVSNDLFIAPPIPTTTITETTPTFQVSDETPGPSGIGNDGPEAVVNEDPRQAAVMTFHDSEEEAGIIPNIQAQGEQNVLF